MGWYVRTPTFVPSSCLLFRWAINGVARVGRGRLRGPNLVARVERKRARRQPRQDRRLKGGVVLLQGRVGQFVFVPHREGAVGQRDDVDEEIVPGQGRRVGREVECRRGGGGGVPAAEPPVGG